MVSESFDLSGVDSTSSNNHRKDTYHVKKKLFWTTLTMLVAIFIVLLALTIYFGVNRKKSNGDQTSILPTTGTGQSSSISTIRTTTTTTPAPPVERIPTNLKQEVYRLTIAPNLTTETFTGEHFYHHAVDNRSVGSFSRGSLLHVHVSSSNG